MRERVNRRVCHGAKQLQPVQYSISVALKTTQIDE